MNSQKKIAFLFPGQGSQRVGMINEMLEHDSKNNKFKDFFIHASEQLGYDLLEIIVTDKNNVLNQTEYTQVAMFVTDVALFEYYKKMGAVLPYIVAGHSLGEWAALYSAGLIDFKTGIDIVHHRAKFMQAAVPADQGAMAVIIGLSLETVETLCDKINNINKNNNVNNIVKIANINDITQIVVAGDRIAVENLMIDAKTAGAKLTKKLPVSVPAHTPLMQAAAIQFQNYLHNILSKFKAINIPFIANLDAKTYNNININKIENLPQFLSRQLCEPVQWVNIIKNLEQQHQIDIIIECGPGTVLLNLAKRLYSQGADRISYFSLNKPEDFVTLKNYL